METFLILAMSFGTMGFIFGIICLSKLQKLMQSLDAKGILEKDRKIINTPD